MPFADPIVKLNPHVAWQINSSWSARMQGDFILAKRTYTGITDKLLEPFVIILQPGRNIPAHPFVGGKEQACPQSIAGVRRQCHRKTKRESGHKNNKPSQPALPENAHRYPRRRKRRGRALSSNAGYKRSRKFRQSRTFLPRFRTKNLM